MTIYIYTDGASSGNPGPMGIGIVIWKDGKRIGEISEYIGKGTNNIAEYTAVLRGLQFATELGEKHITVKSDSELVVKQMNGEYKIKDRELKKLKLAVDALMTKHALVVKFVHIPRERNIGADSLSKDAVAHAGRTSLKHKFCWW